MPIVTTRDGLEIFYKDWGKGRPTSSAMGGRSPPTTGTRNCCSS